MREPTPTEVVIARKLQTSVKELTKLDGEIEQLEEQLRDARDSRKGLVAEIDDYQASVNTDIYDPETGKRRPTE
jgi:predicted  nucleic acid-binding Zn-ribbon protein